MLADEINRATPRTQSALLEAMEERTATVDGADAPLPRPFLVLATQNPIELEGTFPLPEAQLDRFLIRLRVGYPEEDEEEAILERFARATRLPICAGRHGRRVAGRAGGRAHSGGDARGAALYRGPGARHAQQTPRSTWAPARAARWRSTARPRPTPPCRAASW